MSVINNIVACGCSFTQGHRLAESGITWPATVAKKKNWHLHNLACGGKGNEWITQQVIGFLETNPELKKESVVMIAWSDAGRLMTCFSSETAYRSSNLETVTPGDFESWRWNGWNTDTTQFHGYLIKHNRVLSAFFNNYAYGVMKTYQAMFYLKNYLLLNNIQYIFFEALSHNKITDIDIKTPQWLAEFKMKDSYGKEVVIEDCIPNSMDTNYFLFTEKIANDIYYDDKFITFNGNSMLVEMRKKYDFFTEGNDGHPNENACEYFSELIIKEYDKLYAGMM